MDTMEWIESAAEHVAGNGVCFGSVNGDGYGCGHGYGFGRLYCAGDGSGYGSGDDDNGYGCGFGSVDGVRYDQDSI